MSSELAATAARKIAPIFRMNGWEWNDSGIPDENRIAETIDYLIAEMQEVETDWVSTGRITVMKTVYGTTEIKLDIVHIDEYLQIQDG